MKENVCYSLKNVNRHVVTTRFCGAQKETRFLRRNQNDWNVWTTLNFFKVFPSSLRKLSVSQAKISHKKLFPFFRLVWNSFHNFDAFTECFFTFRNQYFIFLGVLCVCIAFSSNSVMLGKWEFSGKYNVINETWKHDKKAKMEARKFVKPQQSGWNKLNWSFAPSNYNPSIQSSYESSFSSQ